MMEYLLKHIKARDILNICESLLSMFKPSIEIDIANGCKNIKWLMWYNGAKLQEDRQSLLK